MQREALLAGGAAAVLSALVLTVVVVPGITASPTDDRLRPSRLDIRETSLAAGDVGGETATLQVTTRLDHRGGTASNIEVYYRAIDEGTGLVVAQTTNAMGNISDDREVTSTVNLTVPREGAYRLDTVVYEDGQRIEQGRTTVRGVGSLVPAYARSSVRFHQFDGGTTIPPIEYSIQRVESGKATVNVSTYLTNTGDDAVNDLRVILVARQADSNIVADRVAVSVGSVEPGHTATPASELTVPDNYSYYLDAVLWKDGVIVGSARTTADLNPQRTVLANQTREDVDLDSDEFAAETEEPPREEGTPRASDTPVGESGPGFGLVAGLVALGGAGLLARRWSA